MGMVSEFRDFAMRGNVVDMAVGIIIGAAFGTIVSTLVDKVFMPPIGMLLGQINFADMVLVLQEANEAEGIEAVVIGYGEAINAIIKFVIVAFVLFMIIKAMNNAQKRFEKEKEAEPPKAPAADIVLLTEIRDLMQKQNG